jgi:hypothetical protein
MEDLDRLYPESKWILTTRDEESWLRACEWFFSRTLRMFDRESVDFYMETRRRVYGSQNFQRELWVNAYRNHQEKVFRMFGDVPGKLLVLDVGAEDTWSPLCTFLNVQRPERAFPHLNGRDALRSVPQSIVRYLRRIHDSRWAAATQQRERRGQP